MIRYSSAESLVAENKDCVKMSAVQSHKETRPKFRVGGLDRVRSAAADCECHENGVQLEGRVPQAINRTTRLTEAEGTEADSEG